MRAAVDVDAARVQRVEEDHVPVGLHDLLRQAQARHALRQALEFGVWSEPRVPVGVVELHALPVLRLVPRPVLAGMDALPHAGIALEIDRTAGAALQYVR